ncbi:MAG: DUF2089 domain-containing protein [Anaerolineales bacterium]|jgi:hypothetical protein|nr:DUF2089 domain-containing protein [Anaerolineales bacterium]
MTTIPQKCPSCSAQLTVTQLTCPSCGTGVIGKYELSPFFRLSTPSLEFLEIFVRNRGNIKEMERETGDSYWSIRRRLDEVLEEMGVAAIPGHPTPNPRQEILERLGRGEINAQEAAQLLGRLGQP